MSKISELSDGGSLVSTDYLIAVRSGGNVKVRMDQINVDQVDLGDNEFIRLGNSQDLTLVHNASNSIINQAGIGDLLIQKAGSTKLTVNSTGIDVTGTVTANGAVIENSSGATLNINTALGSNDSKILLHEGTTASPSNGASIRYDGANNLFKIGVGSSVDTTRLSIDRNTGDISFYEDTGTTAKLFWDASAESLGIGTSSLSEKLQINDGRLRFLESGQRQYNIGIASGTPDFQIYDATFSYAPFTIDGSGNVGIGTNSPTNVSNYNSISVDGTTGSLIDSYYGGTLGGRIQAYSSKYLISAQGASLPLALGTNNTERMRIDASGNLLVGTTGTPNGTSVYGAGFINTGSSGLVQWLSGTSTTSALSIARFYNPNGNVGSIQLSGSATSYVTSSDQRLKENIADADDAGSKVDAIQVRKFDWKADGSHQDYGMVAQELQVVAPEAVSGDANSEEMMGVDYSKLVPMMLKEIQSLRARVAQLENN